MNIADYKHDLFTYAKLLLGTDSPTGYTSRVVESIGQVAESLEYGFEKTIKGCGMIYVPGRDNSKKVAVSAHVDTLGAMVRSITGDGMLKFTPVGGPILPTLDGEYCKILTRDGVVYTGTILSLSPAVHVFPDASTRVRDDANMAVRIDEPVKSKEDVENLGESDFIMKHIPYKEEKSVWIVLKILFVTIICFFGAGFTIMAFHNDIDIRSVFESIYFLFTGEENDGFTILEVAYCIGLASGIILFFNHVGKRKITSDPTPIEVEMKTYEDDVEKTLVENAEREGLKIDCGS